MRILILLAGVASCISAQTPPQIANTVELKQTRTAINTALSEIAAIACAGTPGNTTGYYGQQCQTAAGLRYSCNNASNCTVAADWVLTGSSISSGHAISAVLVCADTSSSATTYTCSTTPTFAPAAGDVVLFTGINQANSGSAALAVNGQTAKTIKKQQNAANLAAGDLAASGAVLMEYDGTNWQMQGQIANAGGGGTSVNVNGSSISSPNFNSTTPAAGTGYTNVAFQVSGSNVSADIQRELTATFLVCAGGCYVGETTNWKWTAPFALTFTGCVIDAVTYPTGAAVTVDLLKGGTTTIFSSAVPTLAASSSAFSTDTGMAANAAFTQGQYLIASVLTAGSTIAGQFVNVVCTATY
jgi:hypothetical protein